MHRSRSPAHEHAEWLTDCAASRTRPASRLQLLRRSYEGNNFSQPANCVSNLRTFMRALLALLMLGLITTMLLAGQSPTFITDPQQVTSQQRPNVQSFDLEKLYLTRLVGGTSWSPDGTQVVFVSNISGRNNLFALLFRVKSTRDSGCLAV